MPRAKKAPGQAVDRRNGQKLVTPGNGGVDRFAPPRGLLKASVEAWDAFWSDRQSALVSPSSKVVLVRWVRALDRYERATRAADAEPLVRGSQGQMVLSPLWKVAADARAVLDACERQLGIGGLYAANLGLAAVSEARSLAALNERYAADDEGGDDDEHDDPRVGNVIDITP